MNRPGRSFLLFAFTLAATCAGEPLTVASAHSLPTGRQGDAYAYALEAAGGTGTFTWTIAPGSQLPPGLSLSGSGQLTGTPTAHGVFSFTVQVTSGSQTASKDFTLIIDPALLVITSVAQLADGRQGQPYAQHLSASGGTGTYVWTLEPGATLPAGLTLSTSGHISGTPSVFGTFSFAIRVTSGAQTATRTFALMVAPPPLLIMTTSPLAAGQQGEAYSITFQAIGGTGAFAWSVAAGSTLPPGLGLSSAGQLTGTPATFGSFSFSVQVNSGNQSVAGAFTLMIAPPPLVITSPAQLPNGQQGQPYAFTFQVIGGTGSYDWSLFSGSALPPGLSLSSAGHLNGTPTTVGTFTFTPQVQSGGLSASRLFTVTIALSCPGGFVGNPASPPAIQLDALAFGPGTLTGTVSNVDAATTRVVIYALTNRYYVQPTVAAPLTTICSDGSFQRTVGNWKRLVVIVVNQSFVPPSILDHHPSLLPGVVAWAQLPAGPTSIPFQFAGYSWAPKATEDAFAPGPNPWFDGTDNVWVDADGLHLRLTKQPDPISGVPRWTAAEVHMLQSLGYGQYTVQLASRVDALDALAVFSPFLYESIAPPREIDIEFSRALATPLNAQYVVQPFIAAGNRQLFTMPAEAASTHRIIWRPGSIEFLSWSGWGQPTAANTVFAWTYTGPNVPPAGAERFRFNLWLTGTAPSSGIGDEVVVRSFHYQP